VSQLEKDTVLLLSMVTPLITSHEVSSKIHTSVMVESVIRKITCVFIEDCRI